MCNSPAHSYKWENKQIVKNFTKKPERIHASGRIKSLFSVVGSQGRPFLCCSAFHFFISFSFHFFTFHGRTAVLKKAKAIFSDLRLKYIHQVY